MSIKRGFFFIFLALLFSHSVYSQAVEIDTAISNAAKDIAISVPNGSTIAVLNMSSEYINLSDYIINELIANLVNTRIFQVVPRSMVEFEAARQELSFQMSGDVSDDSQKSLGQFLGASTIITGTVIRDSENTYRLMVNAIQLENFYILSSYRVSVQNDRQMRTLISDSGGVFYEDYTTGERVLMGLGNTLFGMGSILNGHRSGWVTTGLELLGGFFTFSGFVVKGGGKNDNDPSAISFGNTMIYSGIAVISTGVIVGFVIPFFHHRPDQNIISTSKGDFPFNLKLVSFDNQGISGIEISYKKLF